MAAAILQEPREADDPRGSTTAAESKRIAGLVGPTLIALSASEAVNYRIWNDLLPPVTYLDGTLVFVAGVSIVRTTTAGLAAGRCWPRWRAGRR